MCNILKIKEILYIIVKEMHQSYVIFLKQN